MTKEEEFMVSRYTQHLLSKSTSYPAEGLIRIFKGKYPHLPTIPSHGRLLDAGCGDARNSIFLQQLGFEVHAFEIDLDVIVKLENEFPQIKFSVGTNNRTKYENDFFELIVSWQALYYLGEDESVTIEDNISELHRILNPNGLLITCIPFSSNFIYKDSEIMNTNLDISYRRINDYFKQRTGARLACFETKEAYGELLNKFGFTDHVFSEFKGDWFGLNYDWFVCISRKASPALNP